MLINSFTLVNSSQFRPEMKAFDLKNEKSAWLEEASKIHKQIKRARVQISIMFPKQEHLHPLITVDHHSRMRLIEFLNYDVSVLVPVGNLIALLKEGERIGIDKGNIMYCELMEILNKTMELKKIINLYSTCAHKTYAEAKHLFAEILKQGMWIEEAALVKKVIQVNKKIENNLGGTREDCLEILREISDQEGKYIDSGFKRQIASKFPEIEFLRQQIEHILNSSVLEYNDIKAIDMLVKESHRYMYFLPNLDMLLSLHRSLLWVIDLSEMFHIKPNSLAGLCSHVVRNIHQVKDKPEFVAYKDKLMEANTISYSQPPLVHVVQEAKFLFWQASALAEMNKNDHQLEALEELLESAPSHPNTTQGHSGLYSSIRTIVQKGYMWKKDVERVIRQASELRTCSSEEFNKRMIASLNQIEEVIHKAYADYKSGNLESVVELAQMKRDLDYSERILTMCKCIHKINSNKKIEIADYQRAKDLVKDKKSEPYRSDNLFQAFRHLLRLFNIEVKLLKEFYDKISVKEKHRTPNLFEPKFLSYAKELTNIETIVEAFSKVEDYISLGEAGVQIKGFLTDFQKTESALMLITKEHQLEDLGEYDCLKLKEILEDFEAKKQCLHVRVYSKNLETLALYEWTLTSLEALQSDQSQLETLERLKMIGDTLDYSNVNLIRKLADKIKRGEELIEEVQAVISNPVGLTVDDLLRAKLKIDSSEIIVKVLKKQVYDEYAIYEVIEKDFLEAKSARNGQQLFSLPELKSLLREVESLKYRSPEIEATLKVCIGTSEALLRHATDQTHADHIVDDIEAYHSSEVKCKEAETLLRHRQLALEYLNKPSLAVEKLSFKEIVVLEKSITNSLDAKFHKQYDDKILKRKVALIQALERKSADPNLPGVINLNGLKSIFESMQHNKQMFSNDEIDFISEKIRHGSMYVTELNKLNEEQLKKCKKVLFNFLDVNSEVNDRSRNLKTKGLMEQETLPESEKDKHTPTKELKSHEQDHQTRQNGMQMEELNQKSDKKAMRKENAKLLKSKLLSVFPSLDKDTASEQGRLIEYFVYCQSRPNLTTYRDKISQQERLIDKLEGKHFLVTQVYNQKLPLRLLTKILEESPDKILQINSEDEARKYIRELKGVTIEDQEVHNDEGSLLGKRCLPILYTQEELELIKGEPVRKLHLEDSADKRQPVEMNDGISLDATTEREEPQGNELENEEGMREEETRKSQESSMAKSIQFKQSETLYSYENKEEAKQSEPMFNPFDDPERLAKGELDSESQISLGESSPESAINQPEDAKEVDAA